MEEVVLQVACMILEAMERLWIAEAVVAAVVEGVVEMVKEVGEEAKMGRGREKGQVPMTR